MNTMIMTGGVWPKDEQVVALYHQAEYTICCDGAAKNAVHLGLFPNMLIGDMDSISTEDRRILLGKGVKEVRLKSEKDETDTQAACDIALALGAKKVVIIGGLGLRTDHSLGNIQCLWRMHRDGVEAFMESGCEVAHIVSDTFPIGQYEGLTFSLIPLLHQTEVFRMTGVQYPLSHAALTLGSTLGLSNVVIKKDAQLWMQSGTVLLLVNRTV
jgi:thiamine pyrophosphokinase